MWAWKQGAFGNIEKELVMVEVGKQYFYKTTKSRGRPFVGEVTRKMGALTELVNRKGETVRIQSKYILRPYAFKPYNKAA